MAMAKRARTEARRAGRDGVCTNREFTLKPWGAMSRSSPRPQAVRRLGGHNEQEAAALATRDREHPPHLRFGGRRRLLRLDLAARPAGLSPGEVGILAVGVLARLPPDVPRGDVSLRLRLLDRTREFLASR